MTTYPVEDFEAAQRHLPQVARWTIGSTIYVLESASDYTDLEGLRDAAVSESKQAE